MAENCWCNLKFHLPGEKARHDKAHAEAKELLEKAEAAQKRKK